MTDDEVAAAWATVSWTDLPPDLTDPSLWLLAEARYGQDFALDCLTEADMAHAYHVDCSDWLLAEARWCAEYEREHLYDYISYERPPFPWETP